MIKRIIGQFKYIRKLEAEIGSLRSEISTLQHALDNASSYAILLETIKREQEKQIARLNIDITAISSEIAARRLCYGKDKETLIVENLDLHKENEELRAHLNGRRPS